MKVLENIEPKNVMRYFEEICAIPHGSKNTKNISDYLVDFARAHGLKHRQDRLNNVIIWKPGTAGSEDKPAVIIQGHMDMVCETSNSNIDMLTTPLSLYVDGDEIKAKDTTLGSDDGIAVAMALAILDSNDIAHPPIEAVFTVDEEIGMLGAAALDVSDLNGKMLLNIDSELEGIFTVSCAGGATAKAVLPVVKCREEGPILQIKISGLTGGHSGIEIDKNRANAINLLGRVLLAISEEYDVRVREIKGGSKDNAIAIEAEAQILLAGLSIEETEEAVSKAVKITSDITKCLKNEYATTDPDMMVFCRPIFKQISASDVKGKLVFETTVSDHENSKKIIYMLTCLPSGIQRMNPVNKEFVQTSINPGILEKNDNYVVLTLCARSSVASEKKFLLSRVKESMKRIGGNTLVQGDYPSWEYRAESPLRDVMVEVYKEQYGEEPKIEAVHAGLECGYFADKIEGLDCISFGPNLSNIHTAKESMNIPSVGRVYKMVLEVLKRLA